MKGWTPTKIPDQRAIVDRAALVERLDGIANQHGGDSVAARQEVLALFKTALKDGRNEIRRRFESGRNNITKGRAATAAHCFLMDQLIRALYDFAFEKVYPAANPTAGERQAVVAVGGYGRGELAPHSDIDLLFLLSYKITPHVEQIIEYMLYMLWDMGLKVGHATRSVDESLRMARSDTTIRTALLEARYLWGDQAIFTDLRRRFRELARETSIEFVETKLAERDERHDKLGDSRYVLEPNVKEGKGGLRDLHTLFWIAKYVYQLDDIGDLVGQDVFTNREIARFEKAHAFLTTVRAHLHYLTGRAEERLTFDMQPRIAERMDYRDRPGVMGVERFMKHYYLVAKQVGDLTRIFCAALEAEQKRRPKFSLSELFSGGQKEVDGFVLEGGRLTVAKEDAFKKDPVNFLRLFRVAQENDLDIHPAALRLITQNLALVDHDLRENAEANRLFLEILTSKKDPAEALKRMNEAGVFGRFIPDFGRVVAQMQYDMYHVFTVDEHTIRAIDLLHKIDVGRLKDDHPVASEAIKKVQSRRALYVGLLLHDIAKGRGGDHSELGGEVAEKLGPRLGLSDEETETVAWLVRNHLIMSMTAQKRDIDDPKTITDFAAIVQSPERLRLLVTLTVADMRATGPQVWNEWKATLLRELYHRTEEVLAGEAAGGRAEERAARKKAALQETLGEWPKAEVERFLELGYPGYWLSLDTETHARHAALVRRAREDGEKLVIEAAPHPEQDITEVTVYAPDHPGLFSMLAGAMAMSNVNIVDAKIFTLTNGQALDTLLVQSAEGESYAETDRLSRLKSRIEGALRGTLRLDKELEGRESLPKRARVFAVPPRVMIDNEASRRHTVIEVNGRDRPGFLYDVTRTLTDLGLQIASAKISTFGERVVDVFYVKDVFGMKIENRAKIEQVREALMDVLSEGDETEAAAKRAEKVAAAE